MEHRILWTLDNWWRIMKSNRWMHVKFRLGDSVRGLGYKLVTTSPRCWLSLTIKVIRIFNNDSKDLSKTKNTIEEIDPWVSMQMWSRLCILYVWPTLLLALSSASDQHFRAATSSYGRWAFSYWQVPFSILIIFLYCRWGSIFMYFVLLVLMKFLSKRK